MFNIKFTKPVLYTSAVATTIGIACLIKESIGKKYERDASVKSKVVVITGANCGIGKETAMELAKRGATVYMACRSMKRCEEARKDIVLSTKNRYVYCRECDLASLKSIRNFVKNFNKEQKQLDILINNAGVMRTPQGSKTQDGFEMQLGVNHLGHFLLTNLLLEKLKTSGESRVINVSSVAHKRGRINKQDLNSDQKYEASAAYSQSKLANVLFTKELAKRLQGTNVSVNAVHPGLVDTQIIRYMSFFNSWIATILIKPFVWPFIKSPAQGAQTVVYAAVDPDLKGISGKYFCDLQEAPVAPAAEDIALAKWLWTVSEKWTRLKM